MPYKSDAQRRFFHTDTAKKKGITEDEINEFDKASKGMKLPEKKMAFGGETNPKHETISAMENNPSAGFAKGGEVKESPNPSIKDDDYGTLVGLRNLLRAKAQDKQSTEEEFLNTGEATPRLTPDENENQFLNTGMGQNPPVSMADGGDVPTFPNFPSGGSVESGNYNTQALQAILNPMNNPVIGGVANAAIMPGLQQKIGDVVNSPAAAGAVNNVFSTSVTPPPQPPIPPTPQPINVNASVPPPSAPLAPGAGGPSLSQASQAATQGASTEPSIYQGIGAPDRAALAQQLLAQKAQPANLAVSGAAGLADTITGAFGKNPTNFQQNIRGAQQQNVESRLGIMDTERQQKMQDLQANIMVQENDPNSDYSKSARNFAGSMTGKQFPSGVTAAQIKSLFPDIVKIMDSQLTNATARYKTVEEAQKAGADQGMWHMLGQKIAGSINAAPNFTGALAQTAGASNTAGGGTSNGWKVIK